MHLHRLASQSWFLFIHLTYAHLKLEQPVPYGASSLNTNPLETSGADWPCKQRPGVYDITKWNVMPIDTPQVVSFQGQATHGGGSCQISLTRDTPPTKDSVFKVIKSIEGGCPSTNPGNVGTDPFGYGADQFAFFIPGIIPPANYTLAWTWFNKIGVREMYMNCAPITVTAGKKVRRHERHKNELEQRIDYFDSLPNMFRANSGNGCSTAQSGTVLAFPPQNRGQYIQKIGSEPLTPPVGTCGEADTASDRPAPQSFSSASHHASTAATSAALPPSQTPAASAAQATLTATAPPKSGVMTGTCPTPGKSVCSPDVKAWGTCMENHQVIYQPVAVGTKCDPALGVEVPA